MRKALIMVAMLGILVSSGFSAITDPTAAAKVNISSESVKEIVNALRPIIPVPLEFHGTEYMAGEPTTPFLQLKDQQGNWVLNGSCTVDIFYPNKTAAVKKAPMLYLPDSDGIYFYTFNPPTGVIGLYPMTAECTHSNVIRWYYTTPGYNPFSQYGIDCGTELINMTTYSGTTAGTSPIVLNTPTDWQYVQTASGGGKKVNATFKFNTTTPGCQVNKTREPTTNIFFMGEASAQTTLTLYVWNWNSSEWNTITTITQVGLATTSVTSGATDFISISINSLNYTNGDGTVILMGYVTGPSTFTEWWDWFALETVGNGTVLTDLKGSSELHIWNSSYFTSGLSVPNILSIATQINNTLNLTVVPNQDLITGLGNQINSTLNQTIYPATYNISQNVWNYELRNLTTFNSLVNDIWTNPTRTLTSFGTLVSDIWAYATRTLTTSIPTTAEIWAYVDRTVTAGNITNVINPTYCANCSSGGGGGSNLTAQQVWEYGNRTLTNGGVSGYARYDCIEIDNGVEVCTGR